MFLKNVFNFKILLISNSYDMYNDTNIIRNLHLVKKVFLKNVFSILKKSFIMLKSYL